MASRREILRLLGLSGVAGVATVVGCRPRIDETTPVPATEATTPIPGATATGTEVVIPQVETPVSVATEVVRSVEQAERAFERMLWQAGEETVFWAQPLRKVNGEWVMDPKRPERERLVFSGIKFRVADVGGIVEEDGISYYGFVSGVTGDSRTFQTLLARETAGGWEFPCQPVEDYIDQGDGGVVASYNYIVGESHFYLNKAWNVGQSARIMTESMMKEPIRKRGGEFSMLQRLNAKENFFNKSLYKDGWALNADVPVAAGGNCGGADSLGRMFKQAEMLGYGVITESKPHSVLVYDDMPYGGAEDSFDATVFYDPNGYSPDLRFLNTSEEDLWIITRISYFYYGLLANGEEFQIAWWSGLSAPSPVRMAMSVELSRKPPTEEDLLAIEEQLAWLDNFMKTRPKLGTVVEKPVEVVGGPAYYDSEEFHKSYVLESGTGNILDIPVDPEIMAAVEKLDIKVNGDITKLLISALPVDNAPDKGDSVLIHFSADYYPRPEMITVVEGGLMVGEDKEKEKEYLARTAIESLLVITQEAKALGMDIYVGSAFRDAADQARLNSKNPGAAAALGNSEHFSGMAADLYFNYQMTKAANNGTFVKLMNQHGWVNSLTAVFDPAHYFFLDGVWPGLTGAVLSLKDGYKLVNSRYGSVQARLAVIQLAARQAQER